MYYLYKAIGITTYILDKTAETLIKIGTYTGNVSLKIATKYLMK